MGIPLFFTLFLLLFFSLHALFYLRVIKKLLFSKRTKQILTLLLGLNFVLNILYVVGRYLQGMDNALYYICSLSIGTTFILLLYLVIHEFLNLFHKLLTKLDYSKRDFLKKSGDGAMLALSTSYLTAGVYEGSKEPVVNIIPLGKFDFTIVQISDLHIGGLIDQGFVQDSVAKINALKPDIVCITGDLIDTPIASIKEALLELNLLKTNYGVYYILGNHEYFHNPLEIIHFCKRLNLTLLLNTNIQIDALKLNIVGVTDLIGYRIGQLAPNIHQAFEGCNPTYQTLLLAHQPKFIEELDDYTPTLILSGHTHGGQIWPFEYLVRLQQPYTKGLHTLPNGSMLYVNSGIGFWGPPMRLDSQAEISYFT